MQVKSFAMTLGAGMLAGAAVMMMVPKRSQVYKTADDAAKSIKHYVSRKMDDIM
ncbi:MAG: hypothetical protein HFF17_12350 [Oscillospiraceae bacterium]|nr:hypothetical protein [Oscillospiraceae bacterium]